MNALRPKTKFVSVIGSYGWGGSIVSKKITELLPGLKSQLQFFDPVLVQGLPKEDDFKALDRLANEIDVANQAMEKSAS
jgi:flavorubredoxin